MPKNVSVRLLTALLLFGLFCFPALALETEGTPAPTPQETGFPLEEDAPSTPDAEETPSPVQPEEEEETESVSAPEETLSLEDGSLEDNDLLLSGYLEELFYSNPGISLFSSFAGDHLSPVERGLYNSLKTQIEAVAAGTTSSTVFTVSLSDLGITQTVWTAQELGVSDITDQNAVHQALLAKVFAINWSSTLHALVADCPYDLYWFDKTAGWVYTTRTSYIPSSANQTVTLTGGLTVRAHVAAGYGSDYTVTNGEKVQAAQAAAQTAQSIVSRYESLSDSEKLDAYRAEILALASYDYSADDKADGYGDPWQLVYVFDGDPDTQVVCEGYAKALQYLCDLSGLTCYTVSGVLTGAGQHMWNILSLDGANYLADLTNCDSGQIGDADLLFLAGGASSDGFRSFSVTVGAETLHYTYDARTLAAFSTQELTLSAQPYTTGSRLLEATATLAETTYIYDGQPKQPVIQAVTFPDGSALPQDAYTISYQQNVNAGTGQVLISALPGSGYTGSISLDFSIQPAPLTAGLLAPLSSQVYTGQALTPAVLPAEDGSPLSTGDYLVDYQDNLNAGTASVTLTGTGNYTGTVSLSFQITPAPVTCSVPDQELSLATGLAGLDLSQAAQGVNGELVNGSFTWFSDQAHTLPVTALTGQAGQEFTLYWVFQPDAGERNYLQTPVSGSTLFSLTAEGLDAIQPEAPEWTPQDEEAGEPPSDSTTEGQQPSDSQQDSDQSSGSQQGSDSGQSSGSQQGSDSGQSSGSQQGSGSGQSSSSQQSSGTTAQADRDTPHTGDENAPLLWTGVGIVSLFVLVLALLPRKQAKGKHEK